jgi:ethanolamine ammonia-lyase large subunit
MTYEELLELEEKIGNVSKGLPEEVIEAMEKFKVEQDLIQNEEKCAVCYCNFEL